MSVKAKTRHLRIPEHTYCWTALISIAFENETFLQDSNWNSYLEYFDEVFN